LPAKFAPYHRQIRVQEAAKLGFTTLVAPGASMKSVGKTKIKIHSVRTLSEAEKIAL
jgi:predicted ATP-dependent serine protease